MMVILLTMMTMVVVVTAMTAIYIFHHWQEMCIILVDQTQAPEQLLAGGLSKTFGEDPKSWLLETFVCG